MTTATKPKTIKPVRPSAGEKALGHALKENNENKIDKHMQSIAHHHIAAREAKS